MSRGKIIAGIVVLVIVIAVVAGVAYSAQGGAAQITTAKATKETLGVIVTASGKVEAASRADVYPPTAGTLLSVETTDGASVKAGEILAIMDPGPIEAQIEQARSGVSAARAQLEQINNGVPSAIDRAAASAGVTAANTAYSAANTAYQRFLAAYKAAPDAVKPSLEATLTTLKISRDQAFAGLQSAKSGQSKLSAAGRVAAARASANAAVNSACTALRVAQETLEKATMRAPTDGIVTFNAIGAPGADGTVPKAAPGAGVAPQSAPFTVIQLTAADFNAQVDEADIDKVRPGMRTKVLLDAFPAESFDGSVEFVKSTAIQTTTGGIAFPVIVKVNGNGKRLLIGMSGSVDIEVEAVPDAVTVPIEAILDDNGKKYVFVIENGKAKKVEVKTGSLTDTRAEIVSGIKEGDIVATNKLSELKDGMNVRTQ